MRTSVLKPAKKQSPLKEALDSLAADGVVTKAAEEGVGKVPDLFRSVSSAVSPNAPSASSSSAVVPASQSQSLMGGELANKLMRYPKGRIDEVWKLVGELSPVWLGEVGRKGVEWWRKERVSRVVEGCFESRKLDVLVIECEYPFFILLSLT